MGSAAGLVPPPPVVPGVPAPPPLTRLILTGPQAGEWVMAAPYWRTWRERLIVVPEGFITDGPSIPSRLRSIIPVRGLMWPAAICHDWLYWATREAGLAGWTRDEADDAFRDLLREDGVSRVTRTLMHAAVRAGGWAVWDKPDRS